MTKKLEEELNLPDLDQLLEEEGIAIDPTVDDIHHEKM